MFVLDRVSLFGKDCERNEFLVNATSLFRLLRTRGDFLFNQPPKEDAVGARKPFHECLPCHSLEHRNLFNIDFEDFGLHL